MPENPARRSLLQHPNGIRTPNSGYILPFPSSMSLKLMTPLGIWIDVSGAEIEMIEIEIKPSRLRTANRQYSINDAHDWTNNI